MSDGTTTVTIDPLVYTRDHDVTDASCTDIELDVTISHPNIKPSTPPSPTSSTNTIATSPWYGCSTQKGRLFWCWLGLILILLVHFGIEFKSLVLSSMPTRFSQLTLATSDSSLSSSLPVSFHRRPYAYEWASFESPRHNFGRPTIRLICTDVAPFEEEREWQEQEVSKPLYQHLRASADCEQVRLLESASTTLIPAPPSSFFRQRAWPAGDGLYQVDAHPQLKHEGVSLVVHFPSAAPPSSQGPMSLHAIANELHRNGFPGYMHFMSPSGMDPELPNVNLPLNESQPWYLDERVTPGFIFILPEANYWLNPEVERIAAEKGARILKLHLGWHGPIYHQVASIAANLCLSQRFMQPFKCSRQFMPRLTPIVMDTAREYAQLPRAERPKKEPLVIYDNDMGPSWDVEAMRAALPNITFIELQGFQRNETLLLLQRAMVTIDFGLPGREAINSEGSLFNCITLLGYTGVGISHEDFPFPAKYHIDLLNRTAVIETIRDAVENYEQRIHDFTYYRELSRNVPHIFARDISLIFHARSILFYFYAPNLHSIIHVLASIVTIQHLYPLALIEILTPVHPKMLEIHQATLWLEIRDYIPYVKWNHHVNVRLDGPIDPLIHLITPPITQHSLYTIFVPHGATLFLGHDLINEHIARMNADSVSILSPSYRIGLNQPLRIDLTIPIFVRSQQYWADYQAILNRTQDQPNPIDSIEALFHEFSIKPDSRSSAPLHRVPLPLDIIVIEESSAAHPGGTQMSFYLTRQLRVPLTQSKPTSPLRDDSLTPAAAFAKRVAVTTDLINTEAVRVTLASDIPHPLRYLITQLLHDPLWRLVEPHLPTVYQQLRYLV